jgi:AcrR family transcriptional regulator
MDDAVNGPPRRRRYDASRRRAAAQGKRRTLVEAAHRLFLARGYAGTTMAAIASAAGVSHETVYALLGSKAAVFRAVVETALSDTGEPVHPLERDYARAVLAERDPVRIVEVYAEAMRLTQERVAPLVGVLDQAAATDADLRAYRDELVERRARYAGVLARHIAEVGGLRDGLAVETAADTLFAMNSAEFFLLLTRDRGWTPEAFGRWLADTWRRLLLADEDGGAGRGADGP